MVIKNIDERGQDSKIDTWDTSENLSKANQLLSKLKAEPNSVATAFDLMQILPTLKNEPCDKYLYQIIDVPYFPYSNIFSNFEYLTLLNEKKFIDTVIKKDLARVAIAKNAEKISSYSMLEIADMLFMFKDYVALAELCAKNYAVDHKKIANGLLETGNFREFISHLDSFVEIDYEFAYRQLIQHAKQISGMNSKNIVFVLNRYMNHWGAFVDIDTDLDLLLSNTNFFYNIEKMPDNIYQHNQVSETFARITPSEKNVIFNNLFLYKNYSGLRKLLTISSKDEREHYKQMDRFIEQYKKEKNAQNTMIAHDLLQLIQLYDPQYTDQELEAQCRLEQKNRKENKYIPKKELIVPTDIRKLILKFYILAKFSSALEDLIFKMTHSGITEKHSGLMNQEAEFASILDRALFSSLKKELSDKIQNIFLLVREFCLVAIQNEQYSSNGYKVQTISTISGYTENQLVEYLERKIAVYGKDKKLIIGGNVWANISRLASEAWRIKSTSKPRSLSELSTLIYITDQIIQIEHNTGNIFSKDPRALFYQSMKATLNFRATHHDVFSLLQYGISEQAFSSEDLHEVQSIEKKVNKLLSAKTKTKGE